MLADLEKKFPLAADIGVRFYMREKLLMLELANQFGKAVLTTHGATLLSYVPAGKSEVLWVSPTAVFDGEKPVRGGVPVCWPWFGAYDSSKMGADSSDQLKKAHGFARYETWQVFAVEKLGDDLRVTLALKANEQTKKIWPFDFDLKLAVTLGEKLSVELIGENLSEKTWWVTEALHSYFAVENAENILIEGLKNTNYLDKNQDFNPFIQTDDLQIKTPLDFVYLNQIGPVTIHDKSRKILLEKQNSASTIVWNPGAEGVKQFADIPAEDYAKFICVEAGNALQNGYFLAPNEKHSLKMVVSLF